MDHRIGEVFPYSCDLVLLFDNFDLLPDTDQQDSQRNSRSEEKVEQFADRTCPRIFNVCLYALCLTDRENKSVPFVEQAVVICEIADILPLYRSRAVQGYRIYAKRQFVEMAFVEFFPEEGGKGFCFVCLILFGSVAERFV